MFILYKGLNFSSRWRFQGAFYCSRFLFTHFHSIICLLRIFAEQKNGKKTELILSHVEPSCMFQQLWVRHMRKKFLEGNETIDAILNWRPKPQQGYVKKKTSGGLLSFWLFLLFSTFYLLLNLYLFTNISEEFFFLILHNIIPKYTSWMSLGVDTKKFECEDEWKHSIISLIMLKSTLIWFIKVFQRFWSS